MRRVQAAVLVCGLVTSLGLLSLDRMASQQDYQMVAELPAAARAGGEFAQKRVEGDAQLGRTCIHNRCLAHIRTDSSTRSFGPQFDQDAEIRLLRSDNDKALLLEADGRPLAIMADEPTAWDWHVPSWLETRAWVPAFPGLVGMSGLGLLLAAILLALRTRVARRLTVLGRAEDGVVERGWLRANASTPPRRVAQVEDGPVLVSRSPSGGAPYRGDERDEPFELIEGDREEHEVPLQRRAHRLERWCVGVATCTALPLATALALGWLT